MHSVERRLQFGNSLLSAAVVGLCVAACSGSPGSRSPAPPPTPSVERAPYADELDRYLEQAHRIGAFNGVALLAKDGEIQYERSLGVAEPKSSAPLTASSSFRLASVSKQFIAMAVMILQERGKLAYDDSIERFLPELPYEGITVRHLLNHTAGLPEYMDVMDEHWDTENKDGKRTLAGNEEIVAALAAHAPPVAFAPNQAFAYSNTGYVLLGTIVARASGTSVHAFMKENIFDKLGMKDSAAFSASPDFMAGKRVFGYRVSPDGATREANDWSYLNGAVGDGGIYASARDLLRWDQALLGEALVRKQTLAAAFQPARLSNGELSPYGFGWALELSNGALTAVGHSGSWVGFRTVIRRDLANKKTLILLTNNTSAQFDTMVSAVERIADGEAVEPLVAPVSQAIARAVSGGERDISALYASLRRDQPNAYDYAETHLNLLGYFYLGKGQHANAVRVLRLNAEAFPQSYNVHDSLGEALAEAGDDQAAIASYRRSVELFPPSASGRAAIARLGGEMPPPYQAAEGAFDDLIGVFVFPEGLELDIRRKGAEVSGALSGMPHARIHAATATSFYMVEPPIQLELVRPAGRALQLVLHQGPASLTGTKKLTDN